MNNHRETYRKAAPEVRWGLRRLVLWILGLGVVFGTLGIVFGWFGEGVSVAKEEFGPRAALWKYEQFIEKAKDIDKADANVKLFERRLAGIDPEYKDTYGEDKSKWNPSTSALYRSAKSDARDDLLAAKMVYNDLVRNYNAMSAKFNWTPFQSRSGRPKEEYPEYETQ